ncbi:MAG: hypothetical protein E7328_04220 [Clostridiales bacterium]|nr:hypothetical protein [Clostridiales bacterium]
MNRLRKGSWYLCGVFALAFLVLMVSAFQLTILEGAESAQQADNVTSRTIKLTSSRGSILDANGIPLAYDKESYDIQIYRDPTQIGEKWRALYSEAIIKAVDIIEKNGGEIVTDFAIKSDAYGRLFFDFGQIANPNLSDEALKAREDLWRSNLYFDADIGPREAYNELRVRYAIPEEMDFEAAATVLGIWQAVQYNMYRSYTAVTIAENVDMNTVAQIEAADDLIGISAVESTVRIYPKNDTAAHIIGYMSRTYDEDTLNWMDENGYSTTDKIGVYGVESTMEEYLSANIGSRAGMQVVEVNSSSKSMRELYYEAPEAGNDVILTIDYDLQVKLDESLAKAIAESNAKQKQVYDANYSKYYKLEQNRGGTKTRFAKTGAAVVIDVNSGAILAMSSYPSFDLNLFTGGISEEDYAKINDEETSPMFNKAISSRAEPGSTFKMVTGYAALMEGIISPYSRISCLGEYRENVVYGKGPECWTKNIASHANQTIVDGLKNSCNYFFYYVANRLGIDKLNLYADMFGLSAKTGVELTGEVTSHVANQKVLYDNTKDIESGQLTYKAYLVKRQIMEQLKYYGVTRGEAYSDEQLDRCAERIVQLVGSDDELGDGIRVVMRQELGIPESISYARRWDTQISGYLYEITWNSIQTAVTGIGQSVTAITPIAMARYIAAIANGGTVYDCTVIDKVVDKEGNIVYNQEPKVFGTINDEQGNMDYIVEGMKEVFSLEDGGTGANALRGFEYADDMAGKTGTAQVSTIDLEDTAWLVAFTPIEEAEIAIVVYIPNGYQSSLAATCVKDVIQFYRDRSKTTEDNTISTPGGLVQ